MVTAGVIVPLVAWLVRVLVLPPSENVTSLPGLVGSTSKEFDNAPGVQLSVSQFTNAAVADDSVNLA